MLQVYQSPKPHVKQEVDVNQVEAALADPSIVPIQLADKPPHQRMDYVTELIDRIHHLADVTEEERMELKSTLLTQWLQCPGVHTAAEVQFALDNWQTVTSSTKLLSFEGRGTFDDIDIIAEKLGVRICTLVNKNSIIDSKTPVRFLKEPLNPPLNGTSDSAMRLGVDYIVIEEEKRVCVSAEGVMKMLRWYNTPTANGLYSCMMKSMQIVTQSQKLNSDFSVLRHANLDEHDALRQFSKFNLEGSPGGRHFLLDLEKSVLHQVMRSSNKTITQITGMEGSNRGVHCNKAYVEYSSVIRQELAEEIEEAAVASREAGDPNGLVTLTQQKEIKRKMLDEVVPRIFHRYSDARKSQIKFLVPIPQSIRPTKVLRTRGQFKTIFKTMRVNERMHNN